MHSDLQSAFSPALFVQDRPRERGGQTRRTTGLRPRAQRGSRRGRGRGAVAAGPRPPGVGPERRPAPSSPRLLPAPPPFSTRPRRRKGRGRGKGKCCSVERGGRRGRKREQKHGGQVLGLRRRGQFLGDPPPALLDGSQRGGTRAGPRSGHCSWL